jgi:hypothetical protein
MSGIETINPSQVLAAIEYAKKLDPKDKFGDTAFKVDYEGSPREGKNDVRYMGFQILKQRQNGKWEFIPLNLKFMNLQTRSRIHPPGSTKRKYPGVQIQFRAGDSFTARGVTESYGRAKISIYNAFTRIITRLLKTEKVHHSKKEILNGIQTHRIEDPKTKKQVPLKQGDEIIRVAIPFKSENSIILPDEKPRCDIHDVTKKKASIKDPNEVPFELAMVGESPITYTNIGDFILPGSSCSGVDSMDSVVLSSQGISLPSKATLLIVKPSRGYRPDAAVVFSGDFSSMESSEVADPVEPPSNYDDNEPAPETITDSSTVEDLTAGANDDAFTDPVDELDASPTNETPVVEKAPAVVPTPAPKPDAPKPAATTKAPPKKPAAPKA